MSRLQITSLLDASTQGLGVAGSVHIPYVELKDRIYELPAPGAEIELLECAAAKAAKSFLEARGYSVVPVKDSNSSEGRYCLWSPVPIVAEFAPSWDGKGVLDLGCGSGRNAVWAADQGAKVVGIDLLPDAIEQATYLHERYAPNSEVRFVLADLRGIGEWNEDGVALASMYFDAEVVRRVGLAVSEFIFHLPSTGKYAVTTAQIQKTLGEHWQKDLCREVNGDRVEWRWLRFQA